MKKFNHLLKLPKSQVKNTRDLKHSPFLSIAFPGIIPDVYKLMPQYLEAWEDEVKTFLTDRGFKPAAIDDMFLVYLFHRISMIATIGEHLNKKEVKEVIDMADRLRADIKKTKSEPLRKILGEAQEKCLNLLDEITIDPNHEGNIGAPIQMETRIIDIYIPVAKYVYFHDLIPGERKPNSKEAVYKFIFDLIDLTGYKWPAHYTYNNLKLRLKDPLKELDNQKIHPNQE